MSLVADTEPISVRPSELMASTMPGNTCLSVPSMISAPGGTWTSVPTATIRPARITSVPCSIVPFETVWIVAPRIA
jgi:hypothetical protein